MKQVRPPLILIVDDQPDVLAALQLLLKGEGYRSQTAGSPQACLQAVSEAEFDLALVDMNFSRDTTSGEEGIFLLKRLRDLDPDLPVVVMTAWGSVELAVEAMKKGAKDFVLKPWDNARLLATVQNQLELRAALRRSEKLEAENRLLRGRRPDMIAQSAAMKPVLEMISRVGPSNTNVLITGENGSGKGLVARALHAASLRAGQPLVSVNMGGLSEGVFDSELFGHVRGAFTDAKTDRVGRFEMAEGGTLFLDEVANIPLAQQAKLLRVLETGEYERVGSSKTRRADARFISATNADLDAEVAAGKFRQDLLFRLNTIQIHLPPLRERPEDIPRLAEFFLAQLQHRYRKTLAGFEPSAMDALARYSWPGNVRELNHVVERAVLMARKERIQIDELGLGANRRQNAGLEDMSMEEVEKFLIQKTLARCEGNVRKAAETLGFSRSAFYRRLEKHGL
jgi:DNA-binding NtrC family response regulator